MIDTETVSASRIEITSEIVAAYVSRNSVPLAELPRLISSVHDTLVNLGAAPVVEAELEPRKPAVPVKKSVTDDFIISLEDGRKFKSMKRYLAGLGMTPADYRAKWGLLSDYPMVAPAYAARRSELAKTIGLGRRVTEEAPRPVSAPVDTLAPAKARRRSKAA